MNQIHEKDWAEDDWGWHSGMQSCTYDGSAERNSGAPEKVAEESKDAVDQFNA